MMRETLPNTDVYVDLDVPLRLFSVPCLEGLLGHVVPIAKSILRGTRLPLGLWYLYDDSGNHKEKSVRFRLESALSPVDWLCIRR